MNQFFLCMTLSKIMYLTLFMMLFAILVMCKTFTEQANQTWFMSIAVILIVRVDYLFILYLLSGINGPSLLLVISLDVDCLNQRHVKSTICLFSGERLDAKIIIAEIVDNFFHLCSCLYLTLCPIFRCLIGCILHKSYCSRHELNNTNFFFVLCASLSRHAKQNPS